MNYVHEDIIIFHIWQGKVDYFAVQNRSRPSVSPYTIKYKIAEYAGKQAFLILLPLNLWYIRAKKSSNFTQQQQ